MARKLRVEYPGAVYHVMNRGDRWEPIFRDDEDRQRFLDTLAQACGKTGWKVHAICLMPNHFHLVVETPHGNLVARMNEPIGTEHYGEERQETVEAHAEGIVAEELKRRGWSDEELGRRAKGDVQKVSIAVRVRGETAMTVKWIVDRLRMGAPGYLNHLLYCRRKAKGK